MTITINTTPVEVPYSERDCRLCACADDGCYDGRVTSGCMVWTPKDETKSMAHIVGGSCGMEFIGEEYDVL